MLLNKNLSNYHEFKKAIFDPKKIEWFLGELGWALRRYRNNKCIDSGKKYEKGMSLFEHLKNSEEFRKAFHFKNPLGENPFDSYKITRLPEKSDLDNLEVKGERLSSAVVNYYRIKNGLKPIMPDCVHIICYGLDDIKRTRIGLIKDFS